MGVRRERFAARTERARALVFLAGIVLGTAAILVLRVAPWGAGWWFAATSTLSSHGSLAGKLVVLDPGHGGIDGGAMGLGGEIVEDDTVLAIARYLRDYLQGAGAYVRLTREGDYDLAGEGRGRRKERDMRVRAQIMNASDVDLAVSIHLNSVPSPKWWGAQVFYGEDPPESACLAWHVQRALAEHLGTPRLPKKRDDLYLLRVARVPTILIEAGFLSHPEEARLLLTPIHQRRIALAIYDGIARYAEGNEPCPPPSSVPAQGKFRD
ncbi:MAG: N-acetylmuramoyl-L-alanine amidase [Brockia lithotrophica]|nr:N-acetylmuramoyl-L-alanine amidase [Brockia lithotrophica]